MGQGLVWDMAWDMARYGPLCGWGWPGVGHSLMWALCGIDMAWYGLSCGCGVGLVWASLADQTFYYQL